MTYSRNSKMERWRENEKKTLNRKHGCCYLEGGVGVTTGVSHLSTTQVFLCKVCVYPTRESYPPGGVCVRACACESLWIVYVCECRICMCTFTRELSHTVKLVKPTHSCCIKNITVSHACLSIWMWTWVLTVRVCLTIVSFKRQITKGNLLTLFMHFPS